MTQCAQLEGAVHSACQWSSIKKMFRSSSQPAGCAQGALALAWESSSSDGSDSGSAWPRQRLSPNLKPEVSLVHGSNRTTGLDSRFKFAAGGGLRSSSAEGAATVTVTFATCSMHLSFASLESIANFASFNGNKPGPARSGHGGHSPRSGLRLPPARVRRLPGPPQRAPSACLDTAISAHWQTRGYIPVAGPKLEYHRAAGRRCCQSHFETLRWVSPIDRLYLVNRT